MNAQRRKAIQRIIDKLGELSAEIENLQMEEQEAYDNLPESFQYAERGERMSEIIDSLEYSTSNIEDAIDNLEEAIN